MFPDNCKIVMCSPEILVLSENFYSCNLLNALPWHIGYGVMMLVVRIVFCFPVQKNQWRSLKLHVQYLWLRHYIIVVIHGSFISKSNSYFNECLKCSNLILIFILVIGLNDIQCSPLTFILVIDKTSQCKRNKRILSFPASGWRIKMLLA